MLVVNVWFVYGDDSLGGANQLTLLFSAAVAAIVAKTCGYTWKNILDGIVKSIGQALPALMILLLIGSLAGTWLISGVVPAMIYYGLDILNPTIFLFATCAVCSIVSLATGSSWSTVATVGIALLGIGKAIGMPEGLIAGAIISGAYFGDKMSPLSDTTNLAPAMAGTDLITHIKYMALTTIPSIILTLLIFLVIGFMYNGSANMDDISSIQGAIDQKFNINGWLFIVPLSVIGMILMKVPAIPALFTGTLLGAVFALIFQPDIVLAVSGLETLNATAMYKGVINAMGSDASITTDNAMVNELLSTGGMKGMLNTIWLIICAMSFGGVMEACGMLKRLTQSLMTFVKSQASLITTTALSCVGFNLTASDQYLAIVVPGRMFAEEFKDNGLHPKVLSRTLEDSGTVTSALIPWNTCGAYHAGVLGVATGTYWVYCFFNLISPVMTVVHAIFKIKIAQLKDKKTASAKEVEEN